MEIKLRTGFNLNQFKPKMAKNFIIGAEMAHAKLGLITVKLFD
jgi:hypothetical protein